LRRLIFGLLLLALLFTACKRKPKPHLASIPTFVTAASVVKMNDPDAAEQLLGGFYQIEDDGWRWVAPKFSVALRPSAEAARGGARLRFTFNLPAALLKQGQVTISASVGPQALAPATYTAAGNQTYLRDIPASTLGGDVVVNFSCDRTMPPISGDVRELALIGVSVGLESK
jgi:hypothetical protein